MHLLDLFTSSKTSFLKEMSKARVYVSRGRITEAVEHLENAAKLLKNADQKLDFLDITLRLPPDVAAQLFAKFPKIFEEHSMPVNVITRRDAKREQLKSESLKEAQKEIADSDP